MQTISSRDNSLVKDYIRLCADRGYRAQNGRFAVEGARLCRDAVGSGLTVTGAFLTRRAMEKYGDVAESILSCGAPVYEVSEPVAAKMADTQNPQGIFLTVLTLDKVIRLDKINIDGAYIALENLQDPGNMGTILRTAEALGLNGVLLSADCADLYSPKVLRAAMGATFRIPFILVENLPDALDELTSRGMQTLAAVADRGAVSLLTADFTGGVIAAIGNEGNGLTDACVASCRSRVTIPMGGRAESLNASAAATILMWEIAKGR